MFKGTNTINYSFNSKGDIILSDKTNSGTNDQDTNLNVNNNHNNNGVINGSPKNRVGQNAVKLPNANFPNLRNYVSEHRGTIWNINGDYNNHFYTKRNSDEKDSEYADQTTSDFVDIEKSADQRDYPETTGFADENDDDYHKI